MVAVPGGTYAIGCDPKVHKPCFSDEQPVHDVTLKSFAIMKHEVTMEEYDACRRDVMCPKAGKEKGCTWRRKGFEQHPINCVAWNAADAYCQHKARRSSSV